MMDLLDRYLLTVRHNLPAARADDITAELREDLLDRIEAREAAAGHPLDEAAVADILKAFGHPYVIAARYREHQYLIGPQAYPFYVYALRVVVVVTLAMFVFAAITPLLMGSSAPGHAFLQGVGKAWDILFTGFAIVTILFALFERQGFPARHLQMWQPQSLPDYQAAPPRARWASPIEVGLSLALLAWWTGALPVGGSLAGFGVRVAPTPIWAQLYWPILLLFAAGLAYNLIGWLRPVWRRARLALGAGTLLGGLWLVYALLRNGPWARVTADGVTATRALEVEISINSIIQITLVVMSIIWSFGLIMGLYRLIVRRWIMGR